MNEFESAHRNIEILQNSILKSWAKFKAQTSAKRIFESLNSFKSTRGNIEILCKGRKINITVIMMIFFVIIIVIRERVSANATIECLERNGDDVKPTQRHTGIPGWYEWMLIFMVVMFLRKKKKARIVFLLQFLFMHEQKRCPKRNGLPTGHQRKYQHHLECTYQQAISSFKYLTS